MGYFSLQYFQSTQSVSEYQDSEIKSSVKREEINGGDKGEKKTEDAEQKNITKENNKKKKTMTNEVDKYDEGDKVATLKIPKLDKQFSTYWGTGEDTLGQGVGMYVSEQTVTPEQAGNVVLSGHRDTVFTGLDKLDDGDEIELEYDGNLYEYEIEKKWVTNSDDRSVIVDKDDPTLTLTTCYPFDFIGDAPERYITQATLKE